MGFMETAGQFTGLGGSDVVEKKDIGRAEAYDPTQVKAYGKGASDIYGRYTGKDGNPYDKGMHDYMRTEAEGAISGEENAALTDAREHEQKYGGADTSIKRQQAIRRYGMDARANARRRAMMEFLAARTGLDMSLMTSGHGMAMDGSDQLLGDLFKRSQQKSEQSASRFGAVKDWAGAIAGGMTGGAAGGMMGGGKMSGGATSRDGGYSW